MGDRDGSVEQPDAGADKARRRFWIRIALIAIAALAVVFWWVPVALITIAVDIVRFVRHGTP